MSAPALDPELAEELRRRAQEIKQRQEDRAAASDFILTWNLGGNYSIVAGGASVIVRPVPRWNYSESKIKEGDKWVVNPAYKRGQRWWVRVLVHWWENAQGKRRKEYCPRTFDVKAPCSICAGATEMISSGDAAERKLGRSWFAGEWYVFNAVIDVPRRLTEERKDRSGKVIVPAGLADVRPIEVNDGCWRCIADIMTGGDQSSFAHGDIADPAQGYDLRFKRPVKDSGQRWDVDPAPGSTPLFTQEQAACFRGWPSRLIDLEAYVRETTKGPLALFKSFYGRDPDEDEMEKLGIKTEAEPGSQEEPGAADSPDDPPADEPDGSAEDGDIATSQQASTPPTSPDDEFMPVPTSSPKPVASAPNRPPVPNKPTGPRGPKRK